MAGTTPAVPTDILEMSDEDFLKSGPPVETLADEQGAAGAAEQAAADTATQTPEPEKKDPADTRTAAEIAADAVDDDDDPGTEQTDEEKALAAAAQGKSLKDLKKEEEAASQQAATKTPAEQKPVEEKPVPAAGSEVVITPEAKQSAYDLIMKPFKANGKMIELKSPEEAIQLMQMGANYTRKMQDIQPHRKMLLMLENNGLLDEGKISFLIDLQNKNPDAIKKLVKDSGLDPHEMDTTQESQYRPGNHQVADAEVTFRSVLDDVGASDTGKETLRIINTDWDAQSKEFLWTNPTVMKTIDEQRSNGIYAKITDEIGRMKALGQIGPEVPFLQAYTFVGDKLTAAKVLDQPTGETKTTEPATAKPVPKVPVATSVGTVKPAVANSDKANAASSSRTTPRKAAAIVNPLAMSDDEFMKNFANRV